MNRSRVVLSVAGTVAALMTLAAPATADTTGYLEGLEPMYTSLTREQLLTAGSIACSILGSGQPAPVAVDALYKHMGISLSAGNGIVTAAVIDLGC
ncbi:MAG: hypothetical protein PGN37_21545 [Mycobacterium kyogaense]|uniref:hypothetical protein n=1 Tax=Mycobacterium kyogaense TaxID=2212479 RepID=UPI002FF70CD0